MDPRASINVDEQLRDIKSERRLIFVFAVLLLCIGLFYSGTLFLSHLNHGIAAGVVGDGVMHMHPGDHHEQFYRYSLVYENLLRGRLPYYTAYQYASANFTEGLIFFPFTAIVGLMSFIFGPILSYNLLLLFSYVFVGLAGYFMVRQVTKSPAAGIVAGVFLATVPFRTSFLYGQMVYGVDAVMLPMLIYAVERAKETHRAKHFFLVGCIFFLTITSNFQLFYWMIFLLSPYLIYALVGYLRADDAKLSIKLKPVAWLLPGLLGCVVYGLYIYGLMKGSALQGGQNFAETLFYTPEPHRLFIKFNGNEKNVYLGLTALFVLPWLFYPILRHGQTAARSPYIPLFLILFIVGMFLVFGPIFDRALNLHIWQWMFEHIPGFNGTRTPGRIMAVVIVIYAVLLGFAVAALFDRLRKKIPMLLNVVIIPVLVGLIIFDFNYIKPGINTFEAENSAYRSIADKRAKVVALPFQLNSAHYFNSTFLTYAIRYDLRLLTGHSSFYPKAVDGQVNLLFSLNDGIIDHEQWEWLRSNGYEYVTAHATKFKPNVSATVLGALNISPYLEFMMEDNGVYLYRVRKVADHETVGGLRRINFEAWSRAVDSLPDHITQGDSGVRHAFGWYEREVYPNQKPFRWMKETQAVVALERTGTSRREMVFEYLCPTNDHLKVNAHGVNAEVKREQLNDGWSKVSIRFNVDVKQTLFITLEASHTFESPPDIRKFGCQVGDIVVR